MTKAATPKAPKKRAATPERPRGGEARRIADLVPAIGDAAFRKFGFVQSSIITRWPEIVGQRLAKATRPESLRFPPGGKANGTLAIGVSSAHAPMVQHLVPDIIARVNRFFGYAAVERVKLMQGAGQVSEKAPAAPSRTPVAGPLPVTPEAELSAITDPELRAVLEGLATSMGRAKALGKIS